MEEEKITTIVIEESGRVHMYPYEFPRTLERAIEVLTARLVQVRGGNLLYFKPTCETYQEMEDDIMGEDNYSVDEEFFQRRCLDFGLPLKNT